MSAPRYSSSNYDDAAKKYEKLAAQYTGDSAYNANAELSSQVARKEAQGYAENAAESAQNAALSAGYTRAKAARMGASARANAYKDQYNNSYNTALSNRSQARNEALQAQGALLGGAQQKDANRYQSESNRFGSAMGAVGGIFTGAANALSDETKKNIHAKTDCNDRREKLLARLRG